jgi:hypothetical protein
MSSLSSKITAANKKAAFMRYIQTDRVNKTMFMFIELANDWYLLLYDAMGHFSYRYSLSVRHFIFKINLFSVNKYQ